MPQYLIIYGVIPEYDQRYSSRFFKQLQIYYFRMLIDLFELRQVAFHYVDSL